MTAALVQRQVALAGVALLAALGVLAAARADSAAPAPARAPAAAEAEADWEEAVVSSYGPGFFGKRTTCDIVLTPETRGIAHPVLPCGAKLVVAFAGREALAEVIDVGPHVAGHAFDLTEALARELGLEGLQVVRWRFANEGDRA